MSVPRSALVGMAVAAAWAAAAPAGAPTPFVSLHDTGTAAAASAESLPARTGWKVVPENNVSHRFAGEAVFSNDKLAVVFSGKAAQAAVYAARAGEWKRRAELVPLGAGGEQVTGPAAVKIVENTAAAVMLSAAFKAADGKAAAIGVRLTTGAAFLEVRPGKGAERLLIRDEGRFVVVPDFFAEDVVFDAKSPPARRVGLPAENCYLSLIGDGQAIAMCLWTSPRQNADAVFANDGGRRAGRGCRIDLLPGKSVWFALLEHANIWHLRTGAGEAPARLPREWKPPFPAKWRCSVVGTGATGPAGQRRLVVYPLDRSRSTPLHVFCPIDVMRNTLGVGPCRYVLEAEGLAGDEPATPEYVIGWVERQFRRKRAKASGEEIKEKLARMTRHVERVQARIDEYRGFVERLRRVCAAQRDNRTNAKSARALLEILDQTRRRVSRDPRPKAAAASAAAAAEAIVALAAGEGTVAKLEKPAAEIRAIAAAQDRALARYRMGLRRVRQRCRMIAAAHVAAADFASNVRAQAEHMLDRKPTATED